MTSRVALRWDLCSAAPPTCGIAMCSLKVSILLTERGNNSQQRPESCSQDVFITCSVALQKMMLDCQLVYLCVDTVLPSLSGSLLPNCYHYCNCCGILNCPPAQSGFHARDARGVGRNEAAPHPKCPAITCQKTQLLLKAGSVPTLSDQIDSNVFLVIWRL